METATSRRFVTASSFSQGDLWLDALLAIRPIRIQSVSTKLGETEATIAHVFEVLDDGTAVDHGERPIFWTVVQGQLRAAQPDAPWVAGILTKIGNTFRLDSLTAVEEARVDAALATVTDA